MSKLYAVKVGRKTGIFNTWDECRAQVFQYPGAQYKSFSSEKDALDYLGLSAEKKEQTPVSNNEAVAFVDGSFNEATKTYGYGGFITIGEMAYPISGSGNNPDTAALRNVAGELMGTVNAVIEANRLGVTKLKICYDYQGIENWVTGTWKAKNHVTQAYKNFMIKASDNMNISFKKVEAHTGVAGNELADQMAKKAVGLA